MKLGAALSFQSKGLEKLRANLVHTLLNILKLLLLLLGSAANRTREWIRETLESGQDFLSIYV